ncbi:hypothetical protein ABPG75_004220 [Micractinium tetrahymenae]
MPAEVLVLALLLALLPPAAAYSPVPHVAQITPHRRMTRGGVQAAAPAHGSNRLLAMALTVCNQTGTDRGEAITAADMRAPLVKDWSSVARTWEYCSSGQLLLDPTASLFVDVDAGWAVGPMQSAPNKTYCGSDTDSFQTQAYMTAALALLTSRGVRPSDFGLILGAFPAVGCGWAGLVDPSVVQLYGGSPDSPSNREYADWSSMMGTGQDVPRCYNLLQQEKLGWHRPRVLNGASLPPAAWLPLVMPDTMGDPTGGLRIDPDWAADARPSIYVSWIPTLGSNRGLHPNFANRVYVHIRYTGAENGGPQTSDSTMVGKLLPGQRWTSAALATRGWDGDIIVHFHSTGGPVNGSLLAAISICRRGGSQTCELGTHVGSTIQEPPSPSIASARGRYFLDANRSWQLAAVPGQWYRHYRVQTANECAAACVFLPTCAYFQFLAASWYRTGEGLRDNCRLVSAAHVKKAAVGSPGVTSGQVARKPVASPPPAPPPPAPFPLRLWSGETYSTRQGRLEVKLNGRWGTVCDDGWGNDTAAVACSQLGFAGGTFLPGKGGAISRPVLPILLDHVGCTGSEGSLAACSYRTTHDCTPSENVAIRCSARLPVPPPAPPLAVAPLQPHPTVWRLVGSGSSREGRLEVQLSGTQWGTVCNDGWDDAASTVACRTLGAGGAGQALPSYVFGQNRQLSILLDDMDCTGGEANLTAPAAGPARAASPATVASAASPAGDPAAAASPFPLAAIASRAATPASSAIISSPSTTVQEAATSTWALATTPAAVSTTPSLLIPAARTRAPPI